MLVALSTISLRMSLVSVGLLAFATVACLVWTAVMGSIHVAQMRPLKCSSIYQNSVIVGVVDCGFV